MDIHLYSKEGCGKCDAAKDKLQRMGFDYTLHDITYHTTFHDGWRTDGSTDVLAASTDMDTLPLLRIGRKFHDYPSAMRQLKALQKVKKETPVSEETMLVASA